MPPSKLGLALLAMAALSAPARTETTPAPSRPVLKPLAVLLGEGGDPAAVFAQALELCVLKTLGQDMRARAAGWKFAAKPDGTFEKYSGNERIAVEDGPGAACRALVYGRPAAAALERAVYEFSTDYGRNLKISAPWRNFPALNQDMLFLRYEAKDGFGPVTLMRNRPEKSGALPGIAYVAKVELNSIPPQTPIALEDGVRAALDACDGVFEADSLGKSAVDNGFARTLEQEFSRPLDAQGRLVVNWNGIAESCFVTLQGAPERAEAARRSALEWLRGEVKSVEVTLDGSQSEDAKTWMYKGQGDFLSYELAITAYSAAAAPAYRNQVVMNLKSDIAE